MLKRNIDGLPLTQPQLRTWPVTQAWTLTGNWPLDLQDGAQSTEPHQPGFLFYYLFKIFCKLILEKGERREKKGEKHWCERKTLIGYREYTPLPGLNPQPRHVPWLGIWPTIFWFMGQHFNQLSNASQGNWVVFYYWVVWVLYIFWVSVPFQMHNLQIFSSVPWLVFHFLDMICSTKVVNIDVVQFICSLNACAFDVMCKKPLPNQDHEELLLYFFLMVLYF